MEYLDSSDTAISLYDTTEMTQEGISQTATLHEDLSDSALELDLTETSLDITSPTETGKSNRFFRPLILVVSGLALGVVVALVASYGPEKPAAPIIAKAKTTTLSKVVTSPIKLEQPQKVELPVAPHLEALEEWFEEQPVPVKDRVFLHSAEKHLKVMQVNFKSPKQATSAYEGLSAKPSFDPMAQQSDGRYNLGNKNVSIDWQGAWRLNDPAANVALGEKYLQEVSQQFGDEKALDLEKVVHPKENFVEHSSQASFGPKLTK